jgi:hypothetical protein
MNDSPEGQTLALLLKHDLGIERRNDISGIGRLYAVSAEERFCPGPEALPACPPSSRHLVSHVRVHLLRSGPSFLLSAYGISF